MGSQKNLAPTTVLTDKERQRLDEDGYLVLEGVVDSKSIQLMRTRLDELLDVTKQEHAGTLIVGGLLDDERFDGAWLNPRVLEAVRFLLGDECRMTGAYSRGLRPGHGQQALHADWGGHGIPGVWYSCHAICALVDFTRENGATRVIPGSHRNPWMLKGRFDPRRPHPAERQLVGPAGTVFILNVHCAHSAVHNGSNEPRMAIFADFSRRDSPLLHINPIQDPSPRTLQRFSEEIRRLLTN